MSYLFNFKRGGRLTEFWQCDCCGMGFSEQELSSITEYENDVCDCRMIKELIKLKKVKNKTFVQIISKEEL